LFTALGTLFAVCLRPGSETLLPDKNEISEAINAGVGVLEKVADINSLMLQCHQYFNRLQLLAEARLAASATDDLEQYRLGRDVGQRSMDEDFGMGSTNAHIYGEWGDLSGMVDVFAGSLLPEFDADLFTGL
jgi:hypothetical protein